MPSERVTVTLPAEVVRDIDKVEHNRSRFILEAVRNEIGRRQRDELKRSLRAPHPESVELAEVGLGAWAAGLPAEDPEGLVSPSAGKAVRWVPGEGWRENEE